MLQSDMIDQVRADFQKFIAGHQDWETRGYSSSIHHRDGHWSIEFVPFCMGGDEYEPRYVARFAWLDTRHKSLYWPTPQEAVHHLYEHIVNKVSRMVDAVEAGRNG